MEARARKILFLLATFAVFGSSTPIGSPPKAILTEPMNLRMRASAATTVDAAIDLPYLPSFYLTKEETQQSFRNKGRYLSPREIKKGKTYGPEEKKIMETLKALFPERDSNKHGWLMYPKVITSSGSHRGTNGMYKLANIAAEQLNLINSVVNGIGHTKSDGEHGTGIKPEETDDCGTSDECQNMIDCEEWKVKLDGHWKCGSGGCKCDDNGKACKHEVHHWEAKPGGTTPKDLSDKDCVPTDGSESKCFEKMASHAQRQTAENCNKVYCPATKRSQRCDPNYKDWGCLDTCEKCSGFEWLGGVRIFDAAHNTCRKPPAKDGFATASNAICAMKNPDEENGVYLWYFGHKLVTTLSSWDSLISSFGAFRRVDAAICCMPEDKSFKYCAGQYGEPIDTKCASVRGERRVPCDD